VSDPIRVRPATPQDAEAIHRFISELAEFERAPHEVEVTPETIRAQIGSPDPPFECLMAEVDGSPAGFALFFPNYSTWRGRQGLYLEDIYVSPPFRRRGVARALFRRLAAIAVERGAGRLELSVLDWNRDAIELYRGFGARPLGEWTTWRLTDRELRRIAGGAGDGGGA
jgi:GNAT superfamily N-acetyltransferase